MFEQGAVALSTALARGEMSVVEVMQATLARIGAVNGDVNAIVSLRDGDALLAQARAADDAPRRGWLHGIPIAIKDMANAAGLPTSKGSPLLAGQVAQADDEMVARLRAAGALIIGKTNVPEFGLGSHTFNRVYGATRNPYDLGRSAGGSSGGAAAALAARMLCIADGSDMMGSLRNPAGWNNVYGMRPSWGIVPSDTTGQMLAHQLVSCGPMARCPRDLAALLDTMTAARPILPALDSAPVPQRLGWLGDWGGALPFEAGILEISTAALRQFEDLGHAVTPLPAPFDAEALWDSWITLRFLALAEALGPPYADPAKRAQMKQSVQWEVACGLRLTAQDVQRATAVRAGFLTCTQSLFEAYDVLVAPSAQVWPFDVHSAYPTQIAGQTMDTYHRWMEVTAAPGLLGLPVVSVPIGFGDNAMPAGLQLIGPRGSDARLLQVAQQWHVATDWPGTRPPLLLT